MKPSIILFILLAFLFFQFKPTDKLYVPQGTVKVSENLFYEKTEVSNKNWQEYQQWIVQTFGEVSDEYKNSFPDTTIWLSSNLKNYNEAFSDKKYSNHPVVGITFEQAESYCNWRTTRAKELNEQKEYRKMLLPKSLNYRLPTEAEWQEVAKIGFSAKNKSYIEKKNLKPTNLYNVVSDSIPPSDVTFKSNPNATITAPVHTYFPNELGIFNLIGNVREMTSTKGIAKGGGWKDRNKEISIDKVFLYEKPSTDLGFRCVCEVKWQ